MELRFSLSCLTSAVVMLVSASSVASEVTGAPVVNPHDFNYVLNNPELCRSAGDSDIYMLIWIHTAPQHFKKRLLIRETWGNPSNFHDLKVRTAFFVGDPRDRAVQRLLNFEFEKYGDIIQEDFVDSYRNLTYKAIMGLKWVDIHCKSTKIIFKADDDMVVDVFRLVRHIQTLHEHGIGTRRTILCDFWVNRPVSRDAASKWAVTKAEFEEDTYPPYCPGLALLMTPDLIHPLYVESLHTRYFWVDDVYFTGILPRKQNVTYHPLSALTSFGVVTPDNYLSLESDYIFIHVHNEDLFNYIWKKMLTQHLKVSYRS